MNSKLSKHGTTTRELSLLLAVWLACSLLLMMIALRDLSAPGLYYDETVFAGMAKEFVRGAPVGPHMPFTTIGTLFGRPFPWFVQNYFGGLKCWLLIPSFAVFGSSIGVLRLTTLCLSLVALLFFMLWTRKLAGLPVAIVAGPLLALDPSYFYLSEFDWGGVVPSFLCRASGFYFFLLWALGRKWRDGLLSAVLLGLGLFSKIDFAVILFGCGIALFVSFRQAALAALRDLANANPGLLSGIPVRLLPHVLLSDGHPERGGPIRGPRGRVRGKAPHLGSHVRRLVFHSTDRVRRKVRPDVRKRRQRLEPLRPGGPGRSGFSRGSRNPRPESRLGKRV